MAVEPASALQTLVAHLRAGNPDLGVVYGQDGQPLTAPAPALTGELAGATIIEVTVKNASATYYEDVTALFELGLADKVVDIPDPVFIAEKGRMLPTPIMAVAATKGADHS